MPTPASRAIARMDGSVPADTNTRVATSRSWLRLRVASARSTRVSGSAKRITLRLWYGACYKRSIVRFPFLQSPPKETSEYATTERRQPGGHQPGGPALVL